MAMPMAYQQYGYQPTGYQPTEYDLAYMGYNPVQDVYDEIQNQATADFLNAQMAGQESIPAVQRLVSLGAMSPQQGRAISSMQRAMTPRVAGSIPANVASGIQKLSMINPTAEDAREQYMNIIGNTPDLFAHQAGIKSMESFNKLLEKSEASKALNKQDARDFASKYSKAISMPSDEQKIQAAMKQDRTLQRPTAKAQWDEATWSRAWHDAMDKNIDQFRTHILSMTPEKQAKIPQQILDWAASDEYSRPPLVSPAGERMTETLSRTPGSTGVTAPIQGAGRMQAPQSTEMLEPNQMHIWKLRQDPSLAPYFDAKFGEGAAAKALSK